MKLEPLFATLAIALLLLSCKKEKSDAPVEEIPIQSLAVAIDAIDLTKRTNWTLWGGNQQYRFTIVNDSLQAFPLTEPYVLRYQKQSYSFNYIGFGLMSPTYGYYNNQTAVGRRNAQATSPEVLVPNIQDQSDATKLENVDRLIAINYSEPSPHIKDAQFIHAHTLLDFETVNLPAQALVVVLQSLETTPFNYEHNRYKVIVAASPVIAVKTPDTTYKVPLVDPNGLSSNARYTFKVIFDSNSETLQIANQAMVPWIEM